MNTLNGNKLGFILGVMCSAWHAAWTGLVATGQAQAVLDKAMSLHFITHEYAVTAFDPVKAGILVAASFVLPYALGLIFATIWNAFPTKS